MSARAHNYISREEYLAGEEISEIRHEYVDGEVYAMAGGTLDHTTIIGNLFARLRAHLRGRNCRVYFAEARVAIDTVNVYYYPDLAVQCPAPESGRAQSLEAPVVIAEVLSESTEKFDRGLKFEHYRLLPSLREYLMLSQDRIWAECYRKNEEGRFVLFTTGPGEELVLESLDFRCPMEALYEDVVFPEASSEARIRTHE